MEKLFEVINVNQNSDEWFEARAGLITASTFGGVITKKTLKRSATAKKLINKSVAELLLGPQSEGYKSGAMQRGHDLEDEALKYLNFTYGHEFKETGFLDSGNGYGCSPDGLDLDNKIGLEMKCPIAHTHVGYLSGGELPDDYYHQVQGSLLVTGFDEWVFFSYHPELPCLYLKVKRDDKFISALRKELLECAGQIAESFAGITSL